MIVETASMDKRSRPCKLLFVCSRNRIRSLTAERMLARHPGYEVRSAGTAPTARVRVSEGQINWADVIFVMEKRHQQQLRARFAEVIADKTVICLFIPDDYAFMDDDLIDALTSSLSPYLDLDDSD